MSLARRFLFLLLFVLAIPAQAQAEFMISTAIIEFNDQTGTQQDIELVSRSEENDYIQTELYEITAPGTPNEQRDLIDDPKNSPVLVTPNKTVLNANGRRILRLILLRERDAQEHIYRAVIKPVIKGLQSNSKMGLKILVGYEVLIIVRPLNPQVTINMRRNDKKLHVHNDGNTNILLQSGQQCNGDKNDCKDLPILRVYPKTAAIIDLPSASKGIYYIWNGIELSQQEFN